MEKKRLIEDGGKGTVPSLTYTHFRGWHRIPDHFQQCLLNDLKVRVTYTTQLEHYVKYYSMFTVCIDQYSVVVCTALIVWQLFLFSCDRIFWTQLFQFYTLLGNLLQQGLSRISCTTASIKFFTVGCRTKTLCLLLTKCFRRWHLEHRAQDQDEVLKKMRTQTMRAQRKKYITFCASFKHSKLTHKLDRWIKNQIK